MRLSVFLALALLCCGTTLRAQSNAALSGLVLDPADAVIPGVTITVENLKTSIQTTMTSNEAGVYSFPTLPPGTYKLTATHSGFGRLELAEIVLEVSARVALNLRMQVGLSATIDIRASLDTALALGANSVGGVLNGQRINELPLPDRNALDLVYTQGGLFESNFAGARIGTLNITRNSINVMDQRINSGVQATFFNSVDSVSEVKVIVSPADAEYGRGSGQVHIATKAGTNEFHGSLFESHRNTILNANNWFNNQQGLPRDTLLRNQFGAQLGGPLWLPPHVFGPLKYDGRKRSFFFVAYEGWRERVRSPVTTTVFTATAKQGLFRFYPGVQNANANAKVATVDGRGNPLKPPTATDDLQTISVFGRDANRSNFDPTGWVRRQLDAMPLPNDFRAGDGLNTAGYTWMRPRTRDLNQLTLRFDHQFNEQHSLTLEYLRERGAKLDDFMPQRLPNTPGGSYTDNTNFYSVSLVSSFSARWVNEVRAGASRTGARFYAPWETATGRDYLPTTNNQIFVPVYAAIAAPVDSTNDPQGRISPIYQYADTLTWLRGRHQFKAGGEVRFVSNNGFNSFSVVPRVNFGTGGVGITNLSAATVPGLGLNEELARNLLIDLSGSVSSVLQAFNAVGTMNPVFLLGEGKQRTWRQREISGFFKDEFKVSAKLGVNLGLRYEYYGVPYEANGRTAGLVNGSAGLFGVSGTSFNDMFQPGRLNGTDTKVILVGRNSPNESSNIYRPDRNNFAPAVGLSWQLPWFVFRVGYSIGYERSSFRLLDIVAGDLPGLRTTRSFTSSSYLNLARIALPLTPLGKPLETVSDRIQNVRVFDSNLRTPYVQNWNAVLQRQFGQSYSLEVRYVGNKGTKLIRGANINEVNIFESGLLDAFRTTQEGGNAALFERMFFNLNLGLGRIGSSVNGQLVTASASFRANDQTASFFANNDVGGWAEFLNSSPLFTGTRGGLLLRNPNLALNLLVANPQFNDAILTGNFANSTYHSLQIDLNKRLANGVLFQTNYTFSKALGEEEGSTQEQRADYHTLRDLRLDKRLLSFDRRHIFRSSGLFELPFGPGRKFLASGNAFTARLLSKWQLGVIYNLFSGVPLRFGSGVASYNQSANNQAFQVGALPAGFGQLRRVSDGVYYLNDFRQIADPSLKRLTTLQGLQARGALLAIADAAGNPILVNPAAGQLSDFSVARLQTPWTYRFDVNLLKKITLTEKTSFELRLDAINAFNHPFFGGLITDVNDPGFGRMTVAAGERLVVLGVRINF